MGKRDGMPLRIPAGDTLGWDQRLLTGVNPFLLPNPIAEGLGSSARQQSRGRQTPKAAWALGMQTTVSHFPGHSGPPRAKSLPRGTVQTCRGATLWEPGTGPAIGHLVPGAGVRWKSQNREPGEGKGAGEGCYSGGLSIHITYRPCWACPHCSPEVHSGDTSFSIFL